MDALRPIGEGVTTLLRIILVVAAVFHTWFWIRHGFWVPRYVHVMASIALVIGIGLEP
jgi:hypothetical protein